MVSVFSFGLPCHSVTGQFTEKNEMHVKNRRKRNEKTQEENACKKTDLQTYQIAI